jgi:hypothetical protein
MKCKADPMSPQKRAAWKRRLSKLPRVALLAIKDDITKMLEDGHFDIEIEIASMHCDPTLVHRTITDQGERKLQEIFCSRERCARCPHGPFWFVFRSSKKGTTVRFQSAPPLPPDLIDQMGRDLRTPTPYRIATD